MAPQLTTEVHSVGELIRATRAERDLSLRDVARLIGSTDASVSNWERGKHQITLGNAIKFAEELNIPIEWMIEAMKREMASTPKGGGQSCALTGSNRGPAD
ncbi:helix-turn-helix domain-containing protein, partial [Leucobacter chironomi]|uniref:helix-turn-helix domain-containing protein n=1 Tax=Leucobacter chironomi TaxID=491918 RepID=UPI000A06BA40